MKGFINVIKPSGVTSACAVAAVKRKFGVPCGHMGTLDPMAEGVLPVGIGKASRLFPYMLDKEKIYIAEFKFGALTDTLDSTGKITETCAYIPSEREIKEALGFFTGEIEQVPPNYSAKCVGGKRGYQLARKGEEFSLPPKKVNVLSFLLKERTGQDTFKFEICCKGGTYIRSLARDLGHKCGSLAIMSALDRVKSGAFNYGNGVPLSVIKQSEDLSRYIIPADEAVDFTKLVLDEARAKRLLNGLFDDYGYKDGLYRVYAEKEFWGVGQVLNGILKMKSYVR